MADNDTPSPGNPESGRRNGQQISGNLDDGKSREKTFAPATEGPLPAQPDTIAAEAPPQSLWPRGVKIGATALGVLIGLLVAIPFAIDTEPFRARIVAAVLQKTGYELVIGGRIRLYLLPQPYVAMSNVAVPAPPESARPHLLAIERLSFRPALWPLLRGRIAPGRIVMSRPELALEKLASGEPNWRSFPAPAPAGNANESSSGETGALSPTQEPRPAAPAFGSPARMAGISGAVEIIDGRILYRDAASGGERSIDAVSLDASAGGDGTFSGELRFVADGEGVAFKGRIDPKRLSGSLGLPGRGLTVDVGGSIERREDARVEMRDLALSAGGQKLSGEVALDFGAMPRIDIRLSGGSVDLDTLRAAMTVALAKHGGAATLSETMPAVPTGKAEAQPLAPMNRAPAESVAHGPSSVAADAGAPWAGSLDVLLDRLVYRGQSAGRVHLAANFSGADAELADLSAEMPGNSDVAIMGRLASVEGGPGFAGTLEAESGDLRVLLAWLGIDVSAVTPDRLKRFRVSGRVRLAATQMETTGLSFVLDDTHAKGGFVYSRGVVPRFAADINIDRLDLDAYRRLLHVRTMHVAAPQSMPYRVAANPPPPTSPPEPTAGASGERAANTGPQAPPDATPPSESPSPASPTAIAAPTASPNPSLTMPENIALPQGTFRGTVGALRFAGIDAKGLALGATMDNGALEIVDASVRDIEGLAVDLNGRIDGLDLHPIVDLTLRAQQAGAAFSGEPSHSSKRRSGAPSRQVAKRADNFVADARLHGPIDDLDMTGVVAAAGGRLDIGGKLGADKDHPLTLRAAFPDGTKLVRVFVSDYAPRGGALGPVRVTALAWRDESGISFDLKDSVFGPARGSATLTVSNGAHRAFVKGQAKFSNLPLDQFMSAVSSAAATGKSAPMRKSETLAGRRPGGATGSEGGEAAAPAALALDRRWSQAPLDLAWLKWADVEFDLTAERLGWQRLRWNDAAIAVKLKDGALDVTQTGALWGGPSNAALHLDTLAVPSLHGSFKLEGGTLEKSLFGGGVDIAAGKLSADATFATTGRSQAEWISALNGDGQAAVAGGRLAGFDLVALAERLKNLDKPADFLGFIRTALGGGSTKFGAMTATVAVRNGVAASDDIKLDAGVAAGQGRIKADLPRWTLEGQATMQVSQNAQLPSVGLTLGGSLDDPEHSFDTSRLQAYLAERGIGAAVKKLFRKKQRDGALVPSEGGTRPAPVAASLGTAPPIPGSPPPLAVEIDAAAEPMPENRPTSPLDEFLKRPDR